MYVGGPNHEMSRKPAIGRQLSIKSVNLKEFE